MNIQKLFEESGDPDLLQQLEELETMAGELKMRVTLKADVVKDNSIEIKPEDSKENFNAFLKTKVTGNDGGELVTNGLQNESQDELGSIEIVKEETDVDDKDYVLSLPNGWKAKNVKVGFGSVIKHFIDPSNKRYVSRIDAIRTLSNDELRNDEVEILRSGLVADGWITHPLLPEGWHAKPVSKNASGNNSLRFFTDKNEWFVGMKKAVRLMNNSDEYNGMDLDNLHAFFGQYACFKRGIDENWLDGDEFLPKGWRYRVCHGSNGDYARILSPNGETFSSMSKALAFMVQNKFEEATIKTMISALVYDGWVISSFLPPDWRYRKCKSGRNEYNFLSPQGEMYPSRKTLVAHMRSSGMFSDDDINNINALGEEIRAKWVHNKHNWLENDPSVPPGWKIRYFDGVKANKKPRKRCYILSPSGTLFQSRLKALQFMIQNDHPSDQIEFMRLQLEIESWVNHPMLPTNWRIKKMKAGGGGNLFFTSEGLLLNLKSAIDHIEQNLDKYNSDYVDKIALVAKGLTELSVKLNYRWCEDETIPTGWKMRKVAHSGEGGFGREYFLTSNGVQTYGRVKTIQFLLKQGYGLCHPDILTLRSGLNRMGWVEDIDIVPAGWMKKIVSLKKGCSLKLNKYKFISPDYKEFHSLTPVYHYMMANNYPPEIVDKVKVHLSAKQILSNKRMVFNGQVKRKTYKWQEASFLPPGWKYADKKFKYGRKKRLFLSPNGLLLQRVVLALQVMVEEGVNEFYINQICSQLKDEGWEEDQSLPKDWKLNIDKSKFPDNFSSEGVLFLTDKLQILTRNDLLLLMNDSDEFRDSQVSIMLQMIDNIDNGYERGWKSDETLPFGWKMRVVDLSFKKDLHVMSPDQEEFDSILTAFLYMMNNQSLFSKKDLLLMKSKLSEEGFQSNPKLPPGWLIAKNRGENIFELLSREGTLYLTLNSALDFMGNNNIYNEEHILDIEELCMAEVETYLSSRNVTNSLGKLDSSCYSSDASPRRNDFVDRKRRKSCSRKGRKKRQRNYSN